MSMKDIKNNKENPNMQTDLRSTGTQSSKHTEQLKQRRVERAQETKQANRKISQQRYKRIRKSERKNTRKQRPN